MVFLNCWVSSLSIVAVHSVEPRANAFFFSSHIMAFHPKTGRSLPEAANTSMPNSIDE